MPVRLKNVPDRIRKSVYELLRGPCRGEGDEIDDRERINFYYFIFTDFDHQFSLK